MKLLLPEPYGNTASDAFGFARDRGVLPTWMGTGELRDLDAGIKERAVFSARTTNAVYLQALHDRIQRFLANGYNGDQALLRVELKKILAELGYDPLTGFPGDAELGIPPARPGSLQDLSSDRRINLILETQAQLMAGKGQQQRGLEPAALDLFPAWELVRVRPVRFPRDWDKRWEQAGGVILIDKDGRQRLAALKTAEIWSVLGDPAIFPDALGVAYPPFAFSSGMGWEPIEADEWAELSGQKKPAEADKSVRAPLAEAKQLPPAVVGTSGLSAAVLQRLKTTMENAEQKDGRISLKGIFSAPPPPPPEPAKARRFNALGLLDCLAALASEINGRFKKKGGKEPGASPAKQPGKPCGGTFIPAWKECHQGKAVEMSKQKAVNLLSSDARMSSDQAAAALKAAPHHHLHTTVRNWFDKSFRRLNQNPGSKETKQLQGLISRIDPTPLDVPLYRGMRFQSREELAAFASKVKGGTWPDAPINAFSKRPAVASRFSQPHTTDQGQFNAVIQITSSKSGRDMRPLADVVHPEVSHQEEVIFLPGTKFTLSMEMVKTDKGMTAIIKGHED